MYLFRMVTLNTMLRKWHKIFTTWFFQGTLPTPVVEREERGCSGLEGAWVYCIPISDALGKHSLEPWPGEAPEAWASLGNSAFH